MNRVFFSGLALGAALGTVPGVAWAAQYETFISVDDEHQLGELYLDDEITESTYVTLVELLRNGVDVNLATREQLYALPNLTYADVDAIMAYRDEAGSITEPSALVSAGAVTAEKLVSIAPFLTIRRLEGPGFISDGRARLRGVWVADTGGVPSGALQLRLSSYDNVTAAVSAVFTRLKLGSVEYDPVRDALRAPAPTPQVHIPKYYVFWENDDFEVVAGTYRIGFGQRLTFDTTDRYTPNGIEPDYAIQPPGTEVRTSCKKSTGELDASPCSGEDAYLYTTPDYGWSEAQRGVAAGAKHIDVGDGAWLQLYVFGSYQERSIYQYEIYNSGICLDPRLDDEACSSPPLYEQLTDPFAPAAGLSYYTLPDLFLETLVGGNMTLFADRRSHLGITAYGAHIDWNVPELNLDFQEWSRLPPGGQFGAVGIDGAWGTGDADFFVEGTRSFDADGGGFAGLVRATASLSGHELEGSARYYEAGFANPYAGPISAPDEFEGNRARDETGVRVRYTGDVLPDLELRAFGDIWTELSEGEIKYDAGVRGTFEQTRDLRWTLWTDYRTPLSLTTCVESEEVVVDPEDNTCAGSRLRASAGVRYQPFPKLWVGGQYRHSFISLSESPDVIREDSAFSANATAWLTDNLSLRGRYRFDFEDISDLAHLGQAHWMTVIAAYRELKSFRVQARYDYVARTDQRESTQARLPNPEHWLWLNAELWF